MGSIWAAGGQLMGSALGYLCVHEPATAPAPLRRPHERLRRRTVRAAARAPRRAPGGKGSLAGLARRFAQPLPLIGVLLLACRRSSATSTVAAGSRSRSSDIVVAAHYLPAGSRLTRPTYGWSS